MSLIIKSRVVSMYQQNARVLLDTESREACIVDPGANVSELLAMADGYRVTSVFLTHCHIDHGGGVAELLDLCVPRPQLFHHSEGQFLGDRIDMQAEMLGLSGQYRNVPLPDVDLKGVGTFSVGSYTGKVLDTPGHAPGHVALYFESEKLVIAGDALFRGSIGRTDLPGGNFELLIRSIRDQLLTLPDETRVLCGHGPDTTIGVERVRNPFLN